jgi:hypothetical protein
MGFGGLKAMIKLVLLIPTIQTFSKLIGAKD